MELKLDYVAMGKRIGKYRKALHITQMVLGEIIGVSASHISNIERGQTKPSLEVLVGICNVLGITMDQILIDNYEPKLGIQTQEISNVLKDCSKKQLECILKMSEMIIQYTE